jgi:N-acetylglucosaminyldiphosphoundecaprenol N-acetyl-beta-D-mannosaminyltransferase
MKAIEFLGVRIHAIDVDGLLAEIVSRIRSRQKARIFHLNVHAFNITFNDPEFKKVINEADLVFCDGFGVKIGAKMLGHTIGERMTPPDWLDDLCRCLIENNFSVFLLGDEPGVAEKCADTLLSKHPLLKIDGIHHGFFDKAGRGNQQVIDMVNMANPDVLLVGLGMPLQEKWITANFQQLNSTIFLSVGALFRWVSGVDKRAPSVLSSNGFEGVWRLFTQPKKVWKRYIYEVPVFFLRIVREAIKLK